MYISENSKVKILDCTLRDGGYYNNWSFNKKFINNYLRTISKTKIRYVELGFRLPKQKKFLGNTAYTTDKLLSKLLIPRSINIGVMINAGDFVKNFKADLHLCKKIFINFRKIKFVRIACHSYEISYIQMVFQICMNLF